MGLFAGISLLLLGVLAAPGLLLSSKPEVKSLLDKIVPYQGIFGAICAVFGAFGVVNSFMKLRWLESFPIWWVTYFGTSVLELALGLLLGVGVLKMFIKAPQAQLKLDVVTTRLAPRQGMIGLIAICVGVWCVFANIAFA